MISDETVREVCAEMSYDIVHDAEWFVDRILSAYEREMAAKDAEIKYLKREYRDLYDYVMDRAYDILDNTCYQEKYFECL